MIKKYRELRDFQSLSPQPIQIQAISQSMPAPSQTIQYEPKPSTSCTNIGPHTFEPIHSTSTSEPRTQVNNWIATNENQESLKSASPLTPMSPDQNQQSITQS